VVNGDRRPACGTGDAGPGGPPARLRRWARAVKRDLLALHLAARDPRVPLHAKLAAALVAAYAFSPIDLIPDFVPVLGHLDDVVIVPLGVLLALRLVPPALLAEHRAAAAAMAARPVSRMAAAVIVASWVAAAVLVAWWVWPEPAV
jgi:uncharacterized membrane protein YkvA (DUF1232 family)